MRIEETMKRTQEIIREVEGRLKKMGLALPSSISVSRSNVVSSRIGDTELQTIDMLVEAGLFGTRSEAVAFLVVEGIKSRKGDLEKVSSALEEIRRIRKEAEEHITKLKRQIGIEESEALEQKRACSKCGKDLTNLPKDITLCPYCGSKLKK